MNLSLKKRFGAALLLGCAACGASASGEDGIEQLRAENARLRAQLQRLQQSCPVAATVPADKVLATAPPPAAAAPASVPAPARTGAASGAPATAAAAPASPPASALAAVPAGYKLVPLAAPDYVDPLSPPYDRAGCSRELFKGPPPARWNDADNWLDVSRGLSMAEVEKALGKEHFDARGKGLVEWQYGKCADHVAGRVLFQEGRVVSWQVPDLR